LGISERGTKAKTITSCDNAFVTSIGAAAASLALRFRAKNICWPETLQRSEAAHRICPQEALLCAKAKLQQQQMFSVAKAKRQLQMFNCAKAKRQRQMFSVAKAKRQLQMFNCAKAKRQRQMF